MVLAKICWCSVAESIDKYHLLCIEDRQNCVIPCKHVLFIEISIMYKNITQIYRLYFSFHFLLQHILRGSCAKHRSQQTILSIKKISAYIFLIYIVLVIWYS